MYDYEEQVDISERTLSFNIKCGEERNIFEGVSVATLTFQCENCRGGDGWTEVCVWSWAEENSPVVLAAHSSVAQSWPGGDKVGIIVQFLSFARAFTAQTRPCSLSGYWSLTVRRDCSSSRKYWVVEFLQYQWSLSLCTILQIFISNIIKRRKWAIPLVSLAI